MDYIVKVKEPYAFLPDNTLVGYTPDNQFIIVDNSDANAIEDKSLKSFIEIMRFAFSFSLMFILESNSNLPFLMPVNTEYTISDVGSYKNHKRTVTFTNGENSQAVTFEYNSTNKIVFASTDTVSSNFIPIGTVFDVLMISDLNIGQYATVKKFRASLISELS